MTVSTTKTGTGSYVLEGTAFGVEIWRDPATGHLYASRGASGMRSLDPAVDAAEFERDHPGVMDACANLRDQIAAMDGDIVQHAIAQYALDALDGPDPAVDEHGWPLGLPMPANTSYAAEDGDL